ncbi:MAG: hypothetical protein GXP08_10920 [Gammaproteobacteria bacterium]|nr:hypothetical protein [Gammaproteobacteria bacterium]
MSQQPSYQQKDKPALPVSWITPIRLLVYIVLAGCSAYIYFNVKDLELTHLFIFLPVAAVAAMVLLDCKVSEAYWKKLETDKKKGKAV